MKRIYSTLKEDRKSYKLSQRELASRVGVTQAEISLIEKGDRVPSVLLGMRIANYFGKHVNEMFWSQ